MSVAAEQVATVLVVGAGVYAAAGVAVAAWFVRRGGAVERLDAAAHGAGWGFRLVIVPGVVALWPWVVGMVRRLRAGHGGGHG